MTRLVRDAIFWHEPTPLRRSVVYLAVVLVAAFARYPAAFLVDGASFNDGHALASLELGLNRAFCGPGSAVSPHVRVPYDIRDRPALRTVPLRTLIVEKSGSLPAYCASVSAPFVNNENSLMLLESAILRLRPDISLQQLGRALQWFRIAGLAMFVLLLLTLGASLLLGLASMLWALAVIASMPEPAYTAYPFLFVLLLAATAFYGFALQYGWTEHGVGLSVFATTAGMLAAFIVNMRTSYLPIVAVCFVCFLAADWLRMPGTPTSRRAGHAVALVLAFVFGCGAVHEGLIMRYVPGALAHNAAHPITHNLVIALGVPENDFSRQQNISWVDAAGARLALEVDPKADFLGPRYNSALFTYYLNLWRAHPRAMARTYWLKFSVAGPHMFEILRGSPGRTGQLIRILLTPLAAIPNGVCLLALYIGLTVGAMLWFVRTRSVHAFTAALVGIAACLLQIESGLIYSLYFVNYHNYLAFYAMFVTLLASQALVNIGWRALRWAVMG